MIDHPLLPALKAYRDQCEAIREEHGDSHNVAMAGLALAGEALANKVGQYLVDLHEAAEARKDLCPGSGEPLVPPQGEWDGYSCQVCSRSFYEDGDTPEHPRLGT